MIGLNVTADDTHAMRRIKTTLIYLSVKDREQVIKRFDTANEKSRSAQHCTYGNNNDDKSAIEIWKQMFGDQFPTYG